MDYEKAYKEALERAKDYIEKQNPPVSVLYEIFPELKESEDEKIRKALVRFHNSTIDIDGIKGADILAWLEKQGEQKPTSNTRYKVSAGGSLIIVDGKPFDYEHATITQKDFAPKQEPKKTEDEIEIPFGAKDSELQEATYYIPDGFHAEIDDDKVVIKKGEKSVAWSDEDENMAEDLIKGCVSSEKAHHFIHTPKEVANWLKSIKDRMVKED